MSLLPPISAETLKSFETIPVCLAILFTDFTILTASNLYLQATGKTRDEIINKNIFDAFPENPETPNANSAADFKHSLEFAISSKQAHCMGILRYDVQDFINKDKFYERYWETINTPILSETGEVSYIIILGTDITGQILANQKSSRLDKQLEATIDELTSVNEELKLSLEEVSNSRESLAKLNKQLEDRVEIRTLKLANSEALYRNQAGQLSAINEELANANEELQAGNEEIIASQENEQAAYTELKQTSDTLKLALESAVMGTFNANFLTNIIYLSQEATSILGIHDQSVITLTEAANYIHPDFREETRMAIATSLKSTGTFNEDTQIIGQHESGKWVGITGKAIFSQDGMPTSMIGTLLDISRKKKKEFLLGYLNKAGEELALAQDTNVALEKISALIVPKFANYFAINVLNGDKLDLLFIKNEDQGYMDWAVNYRKNNPIKLDNPGLHGHILRTGKSSLVPMVTEDMIRAANIDEEQIEMILKMNIRSSILVPMKIQNKITGMVNFISTVDGKQFDEEDLTFAKDFAIRVGLALENARLHEQAQNEIRARIEAESKKDEFISVASHELKTPMTTITASIQMLKRLHAREPLSEQITKLIETSDKSVSKLGVLVRELLNVSRLEKGQLKLRKSWFKFSQVINECCDHVSLLGTHTLVTEGDLDLEVFADPHRIDQVIVNFINNAVKYSPKLSEIKMLIERQGDFAKLSVIDQGIGIELGKTKYLFDRYYRVDASGLQYSGLGLGLYISAEIISLHGGEIGVTSELGTGSTFWFTVPINGN